MSNLSRSLIGFADSPAVDGFFHLRMAEPYTIFDSKTIYDKLPLYFDEITATGGTSTFQANRGSVAMAVTATSGSSVTRQTKQYFSYQPGKSLYVLMSAVIGAGHANTTMRWGYFDDHTAAGSVGGNGLFFSLVGTTLNVVSRTFVSGSQVDTTVAQSSWNLDKLDGTGASGFTLDLTKCQIFVIDFEWLGAGRIRFGVWNSGQPLYCHQIVNTNALTASFMTTPSLPVRFEITNTGASAIQTLEQIAITVVSEGGDNSRGQIFSADTGTAGVALAAAGLRQVIGIRLNSSSIRASVFPTNITITGNGFGVYRWALLLNPTFTGGTGASFTSITNSSVQYDVTATGTLSGGTQLASGYSLSNVDINAQTALNNALGATTAGTSDVFVVAVYPVNAETFYASIAWNELL